MRDALQPSVLAGPLGLPLSMLCSGELEVQALGGGLREEEGGEMVFEVFDRETVQSSDFLVLTIEEVGMVSGYLIPMALVLHLQVEVLLSHNHEHSADLSFKVFLGEGLDLSLDLRQKLVEAVDYVFTRFLRGLCRIFLRARVIECYMMN